MKKFDFKFITATKGKSKHIITDKLLGDARPSKLKQSILHLVFHKSRDNRRHAPEKDFLQLVVVYSREVLGLTKVFQFYLKRAADSL